MLLLNRRGYVMAKKIALIKSKNSELVSVIEKYFKNKNVDEIEQKGIADNLSDYDFIVLTGFDDCIPMECGQAQIINIHPSLLPAFASSEALKDSFSYGVKVGGLTVHKVEAGNFYGKIIAQYPVLIGLNTHFDEYCNEMLKLAENFYPIVLDAVINDKVFDFADLLSNSCSGGCGGCHK